MNCEVTLYGQSFQVNAKLNVLKYEVYFPKQIMDVNTETCIGCNKQFSRKDSFRRHMRSVHKMDIPPDTPKKEKMICFKCGKCVSTEYNLRRHMKVCHSSEHEIYMCDVCDKSYTSKFSLKRHIKNVHMNANVSSSKRRSSVKKQYRCGVCGIEMRKKFDIMCHYKQTHNLNMSYELIKFETDDEFYQWKENIEISTHCTFIRRHNYETMGKKTTIYTCNRSGCYVSRSTGKRRSRSIGSKKIDAYCSAHMNVHFTNDCVTVQFLSKHVGHDETNKPCYMNITERERKTIVEQLRNGVSPTEILRRMKHPLSEFKEPQKRVHLLTLRDIRYIGNSSGVYIPKRQNKNDAFSVDNWVTSNKSIVLYYKSRGLTDVKYAFLTSKDFVLILMSNEQEKVLKTWAQKVLIVDSKYMNANDFWLITVMVLDDQNRGHGSCFMFSNRVDESVLTFLFQQIKLKVGIMIVETYISDIADEFLNSWCQVFPRPKFHLYSNWNVLRAWRDDLNEISAADVCDEWATFDLLPIKKQLYLFLKMNLLQETNVEQFNNELQKFAARNNDVLQCFHDYFKQMYVPKKENWACCYRKYAGINVKIVTDSFYRILKYSTCNGKKIQNMYDALSAIVKYQNSKSEGEIISEKTIKPSLKMTSITSRHQNSLKFLNFENIIEITEDNNSWFVESVASNNRNGEEYYTVKEIYIVEKVNNVDCSDCNILCVDCATCIHQYICTCVDNAVLKNMCKHIHHICRYLTTEVIEMSSVTMESPPSLLPTLSPSSSNLESDNYDSLVLVPEEEKKEKVRKAKKQILT